MATGNNEEAAPFVPEGGTLHILREAVQRCHGCELYHHATQAVFGELETGAETRQPKVAIMMIGEQPGDHEDKEGRPFIGPAGQFLDRCLENAEIDRQKVYVTNTVKHFKWEPRGKLRIHKRPSMKDPRLQTLVGSGLGGGSAEVDRLGAVAAQSLLGAGFKITHSHGEVHETEGLPLIIATLHPSAILRARSDEDRENNTKIFLEDLRRAAAFVSH